MAAVGLPTVGFFSVSEDAEWGIVGGLLVLNAAGRPLEFHCTAPLKPNRAQEILYGPTLRPFLYGEQIGATLAAKAKSNSLFLCTDIEPAMCLRDAIDVPLILVTPASARDQKKETAKFRVDGAQSTGEPHYGRRLKEFQLGQHSVAVLDNFADDQDAVLERWQPYQMQLDLLEPFGHIHEALIEAQRGASK